MTGQGIKPKSYVMELCQSYASHLTAGPDAGLDDDAAGDDDDDVDDVYDVDATTDAYAPAQDDASKFSSILTKVKRSYRGHPA